ncbi:MAG: chromosomal replication initiator protein DnaA [Phycisphaerae bacterium]
MARVDRALWNTILHRVLESGGNLIRPWFPDLEPITLEHGLLEIRVPGSDERKYCQQHVTRIFTEAAQAATGRLIGVCFLTDAECAEAQDDHQVTIGADGDPADAPTELPLNRDYTFESFVTGPCNRLAHAASLAISESPGRTYNPLFIHGGPGLGKTHLLHATCRRIAADRGREKIALLSCETFVNHFIEAVEKGRLHDFRYRYRHADMIVIDDIQFLSDHEQTQEEFFHTFNTLYQAQKQIILSCDRGPSEIPDLEERLVSRFNWGLVARIDRPCYETRVAIVQRKARMRNVELPEEVICFIAGTVESNTRELEGAITKVAMLSQVTGRDIDLSLAEEALGAEPSSEQREITIEDILKAVTTRFSVRLADLQSKKRSRSIAFPRQICMYLARQLTRHSLEEIGGYFGGRDHTTVLHADKTIKSQKQSDPQLQAMLETITREIRAGN